MNTFLRNSVELHRRFCNSKKLIIFARSYETEVPELFNIFCQSQIKILYFESSTRQSTAVFEAKFFQTSRLS